jgi:hypothetical protein
MSLTTDRTNPDLNKEKANGQREVYLILSDEERAKGFVRPVRCSYVHVGKQIDKSKMIPVDEYWGDDFDEYDEERRRKYKKEYGYIYFLPNENKESAVLGTYIKETDLKKGCGTVTTMAQSLAETYARDPKFYGATFCCGCGTHLPVNEFYWHGTEEEVGS